MAIYGLGDVAISIVNFLLLGLYVKYLSAEDYGVLGLLGSVEVVAKIIFRFGLDGSFMRFFYDCHDEEDAAASRQHDLLLPPRGQRRRSRRPSRRDARSLTRDVLDGPSSTALRLVLLNTFAIGFTFIPFHVLRIERRSTTFSLLTLARSTPTVMLRLVLVVGFHMAVVGVVLADVFVTVALMAVLLRWFAPLIRPCSRARRPPGGAGVRRCRACPMPRRNRSWRSATSRSSRCSRSVQDIGVYSMAVSFGLTQKLFLSAFESAWAPFYYATMREPDARRVFRIVTTYGVAVLALLTAGLPRSAVTRRSAMTHGLLHARPTIHAGSAFAIDHRMDRGRRAAARRLPPDVDRPEHHERTQYYPVATMAAAATNIGLNFLLIPSLRDRRRGLGERAPRTRVQAVLGALLAAVLPDRVRVGTPGACRRSSPYLGLCRAADAAVDSPRARLRAIEAGASARHPRSRHDGGRRVRGAAGRQRILSRRGAAPAARAPPLWRGRPPRRDGARQHRDGRRDRAPRICPRPASTP